MVGTDETVLATEVGRFMSGLVANGTKATRKSGGSRVVLSKAEIPPCSGSHWFWNVLHDRKKHGLEFGKPEGGMCYLIRNRMEWCRVCQRVAEFVTQQVFGDGTNQHGFVGDSRRGEPVDAHTKRRTGIDVNGVLS